MEILQTQYNVQTKHIPILDLEFVKTSKGENSEKKDKEVQKTVTAVPPAQQPGHTGYLTFATLYPIWARKTHIENC